MECERSYLAIDLKSFYASVECMQRGLDPLTTNLVVADVSRTEKTICLAVSPSLKAYGIPGRARLFEVIEKLREVNAARRLAAPGLDAGHLPARLPDGPARLFVRPEDLTPVPDPGGPWTVASVSNTGAHLRLVLSDAAGTEIPADLRRRSPRAAQIAPGMRVNLRPEHASVFPAETA